MSDHASARYVIFRFVPDGPWQFITSVKDLELEQAKHRIFELSEKDHGDYLIQDVLLGLTIASTQKKTEC
jgi:hypothetical protein